MFAQRFLAGFKRPFGFTQGREKRIRTKRVDQVTEQVKQMLQTSDQKLILMVRG